MDLQNLEEHLKYHLNRYGEFVDQKALMIMQKTELMKTILTPEQLADIDSIEAEFKQKEETIKKNEKSVRAQLDAVLRQYSEQLELQKDEKKIISSKFAKVSVSDGGAEYDVEGLDSYIVAHPELAADLLSFRTEKKKKTRITLLNDMSYDRD